MGIIDRLTNRVVDRAVDTAVDKTVDKVVDETVGKAVRKTANEQAEKYVASQTDMVVDTLLHCQKCGATITKEDKVCPSCGEKIDEEVFKAVEDLEKNKEETLKTLEEEKQKDQKTTEKQTTGEDSKFVKWLKKKNDTKDTTDDYDKNDVETNKVMCIFAYLSWLLLIPLFMAKDSKFARYHVNQGIVLAICETIWWVIEIVLGIVLGGVPFIGALLSIVMGLANVVFVAIIVVGILNALNGKAKELPVIGKYKILK